MSETLTGPGPRKHDGTWSDNSGPRPDIQLSIIIVNYNSSFWLKACIDSVIHHLGRASYEILVADNASTDTSAHFLREEPYRFIRFIPHRENLGFAKAVNATIPLAKGGAYLLLNPDCLLLDGGVLRMLDHLKDNPRVGVLGCQTLGIDRRPQMSAAGSFPTMRKTLGHYFLLSKVFRNLNSLQGYYRGKEIREMSEVDWVSGTCMMIRRQTWEEAGPFNEEYFIYYEDIDFCYKARKQNWQVVYRPETQIVHYGGWSLECFQNPMAVQCLLNASRFFRRLNGPLKGKIHDAAVFASLLMRFLYYWAQNPIKFFSHPIQRRKLRDLIFSFQVLFS